MSRFPRFLLTAALVLSASAVATAVPLQLNHQGRLLDAGGAPASGLQNMTFAIYAAPSGGTPLWSETQNMVPVDAEGLYNVLLGAVTPIPADLFSGPTLYLGVAVAPDPELSPRVPLVSSPYSLKASQVDGFASGPGNSSSGQYTVVGGDNNTVTGDYGVALGFNNEVNATNMADTLIDTTGLPTNPRVTYEATGAAPSLPGAVLSGGFNTATGGASVVAGGCFNDASGGLSAIIGGYDNDVLAPAWMGTIGGGIRNRVRDRYSFVGGGALNETAAATFFAGVGSGYRNTSSGHFAWTSGGRQNASSAPYAAVGGGSDNLSSANYATVAGGLKNAAGGVESAVGGGEGNAASGNNSFIGGGEFNVAGGLFATVSGGLQNQATALGTTVGGGQQNSSTVQYSAVGGGAVNSAGADYATIAGGHQNTANGDYSAVGGGNDNLAGTDHSTVAGGAGNLANSLYAAIGGGEVNQTSAGATHATIGGGFSNIVNGTYATVGGGQVNVAGGNWATTSGGNNNSSPGAYATTSGGQNNQNPATHGTISGGFNNLTAGGLVGPTVGGGEANRALGPYATVSGGETNTSSSVHSTVAGGVNNTSSNLAATVGGGSSNQATGEYATVPGGENNLASGIHSWAGGTNARAVDSCSFVWSDCCIPAGSTSPLPMYSNRPRTFNVRATGGFFFFTDCDTIFAPGIAGVELPSGGSAWVSLSNRESKDNIRQVNSSELLDKVANLPVYRWNYKSQDESIQHIGPMAQDFYDAFGVGDNNSTISTIDPAGIALAAIQALYLENQKLQAKAAEVDELRDELKETHAKLDRLSELVNSILADQGHAAASEDLALYNR